MDDLPPSVPLGSLLRDDAALYRVAQQLVILAAAPGRPDPLMRRRGEHWEVIGQAGATVFLPPTVLELSSDLPQRAFLHSSRTQQLSTVRLTREQLLDSGQIYQVRVGGPAPLESPLESVAQAVDALQSLRQHRWVWGRTGREQVAQQAMQDALRILRETAERIWLTRWT